MNSYQITQTLATHAHFIVFEACGGGFQFPVVLKRCEYREASEAEFFIRSALIKTKAKAYSQPLLSIFADVNETTDESSIVFVWKKGDALDIEVERDEESQFPPGKAGYGRSKILYKNPLTKEAAKRAVCLTLRKTVFLKISRYMHMLEMNPVFREALVQAKCAHPNVCDLLDFRLYRGKQSNHCAYIVMELLEQDLAMEVQRRKLPYDEVELVTILKQVAAALLNAKHQGLVHQDIKPHNIFRGPQGLKLAGFGSTWLKGVHSRTSSATDTEVYISPEAWEAVGNPEMQYQPFESDVFSLGMTMLHLAAMEPPERTPAMSHSELQALLKRKVQALRCSEELKRLLTAMLNIAPDERPPLETVQTDAESIYQQATQELAQEALQHRLQARTNIDELAAAAHAILPQFPNDKDTANNLREWGHELSKKGMIIEALDKYAAAHAILSRLPNGKDTADNLRDWGEVLKYMKRRKAEAVEKYAAAHAILSRLSNDKDTANNLREWGDILKHMDGREAEAMEKHAAAHAILSRLPDDKDTANYLRDWGNTMRILDGRRAEAMEKYAAAQAIHSRLSDDKDTANNLKDWGDALCEMGRREEAVEKYAAAHAIFSRFPDNEDTVSNLKVWGNVLYRMGRDAEAAEKYATAHDILSRLFDSKNTANDLKEWGNMLYNMGREAEAVEKYAAAHDILSRLPDDKDTADNLREWGNVLHEMGSEAEAAEKYAAAHDILSRLLDDKDIADNLRDWGEVLRHMKGWEAEAMEKYAAVHDILSRLPDNEDTANNLREWGNMLHNMGREAEAVEKYEVAHAILSRLFDGKDTANDLRDWDYVTDYFEEGKAEAVEKYATTHAILSRLPYDKDTANNLQEWGNLLRSMGRREEAVEKFEAARAIYVLCEIDFPIPDCDSKIAELR